MIRDTLRALTAHSWARLIACAVAWAAMTAALYCFVWSIGAAITRSMT